MVLCARLESSLVHSCGVPPILSRGLSATLKYLWMLHLPCHITWAVPASTPMTRMIPLCLQPHHHRYHSSSTPTPQLHWPTDDELNPPTPPPVPAALSTPPPHPDTDTNLTSLPSSCNQPGQDVVPKRPTNTRRTPQYLEDFVLY